MKPQLIGSYKGSAAFEPYVLGDDGWSVEILRTPRSILRLLKYDTQSRSCKIVEHVPWSNGVILAPEEDDFTRHVEFSSGFWLDEDEFEMDLLDQIEKFLLRCIDVEPQHRFLLACFVLSSWLIDCLPIAPYVAFVGLPQSGKTTALKTLRLVCRRGLLTSDISSAAFYRVCERLSPTLLIDEAATAGQQRALFHLLRSGSMRENIVLRAGESYSTFGAKVMAFRELPQDEALNSRCIVIPMRETSRSFPSGLTNSETLQTAGELQCKLVTYRFRRHHFPPRSQVEGTHLLRSRDRDLYFSLAYAIGDELEPAQRLLKYFLNVQRPSREPLPTREAIVLETLFEQIHLRPEANHAIRFLTQQVNENLARSGERFRLSAKAVGTILTTLGFRDRRRTNMGYSVWLDRKDSGRIHELMSTYGLDALSAHLPKQQPEVSCEDCKAAARLNERYERSESQIGEWMVTEEDLREESEMRQSYHDAVLSPEDFEESQSDGGTAQSEEPIDESGSVSKFPSPSQACSDIESGKQSAGAKPAVPDGSADPVPGSDSPAEKSQSANDGADAASNSPPKSTDSGQPGSSDWQEPSDDQVREWTLETFRNLDRELAYPFGMVEQEDPPEEEEAADEDEEEELDADEPCDEEGPDDQDENFDEEDGPPGAGS